MGEWNSKEIDDPLEADPPTTRSTIRARSPRHQSNLLGFVRDVGALRRVRGQRRPHAHHRLGDDRAGHNDDVDGRRYNDDDVRTDNDQHRPPDDADDHRAEHDRDDHAPDGRYDRHDGEEGRADDRLHSPDDRAGHNDDRLFVDAVRSGDVLLGP